VELGQLMSKKTETVRLRYARHTDAKNIVELLGQLDRPLPENKSEAVKFERLVNEYITCGDRGIILAIIGSEVIGLVSFVVLNRLNHLTKEFWIPDLIVLKEYRNQGVGKLLIQKCELIAKRRRCYRIRLESRNDRIDSHQFYKKVGFKQIALVFEKSL
jgi:ribosomal protein S18 acetylase RimI-like enzyme